jgi:hypothetical protein
MTDIVDQQGWTPPWEASSTELSFACPQYCRPAAVLWDTALGFCLSRPSPKASFE